MRWGLLLVCIAACYEPPHTTCTIQCTEGVAGNCPSGMTCNAGYCVDPGGTCTTELALVRMGGRHACGLDANGRALCWGDGHEGQIGVAAITDFVATPTYVGTDTWIALATGNEHTCAIKPDNTVWCWGQNDLGESRGAHNGGIANIPTPVASPPLVPKFDKVYAGGSHSCAIGEGQAWCWGSADALGLAANTQAMTRFAPSVSDFIALATGTDHTCGISASTGVWCWGHNDASQSGQPPPNTVTTPTLADIGLPATKVPIYISAGDSKDCVIMADTGTATAGELWCWGYNANEDIAPGGANVLMARQMSPDETWTQVSAGSVSICGVRGGNGYCWGASTYGQNADGVWELKRSAAQPAELGPTDEIWLPLQTPDSQFERGFDEGGCARTGTQVRCWGLNRYGEVGSGVAAQQPTPVAVASPNGSPWQHVWIGDAHTCAQTADGALWCWGQDTRGAINATTGHGTVALPCTPTEVCDVARPIAAPKQVHAPEALAIGNGYTCALEGGAITCWGAPGTGVLGAPHDMPAVSPVPPPSGQTWMKLYGGDLATCATTSGGELECWGHVVDTDVVSPTPANDALLADLATIEFGDAFACAAQTGGGRVCWGDNTYGQLGDTTSGGGLATPMLYGDITVVATASRGAHTCAVTTGGGVACWGDNAQGQCGQDVGTQLVVTPSPVGTVGHALAACTQVAVGIYVSCAICGGKPWCWGDGSAFELGRGDTYQQYDEIANAVAVPPGATYVEVATGTTHGCALDSAGALYCWGLGAHGELGDGGHAYNLPTLIAPANN
jgi:alpha-tubulin suppressor-like RCC1 family protein